MKYLVLIITSLISSLAFGQNKASLGIHLYGRHDQHANYFGHSSFMGSATQTKLEGWSKGAEVGLGIPVREGVKFNIGIGYYKLSIDDIVIGNQMMWSTERRVFLKNYSPRNISVATPIIIIT